MKVNENNGGGVDRHVIAADDGILGLEKRVFLRRRIRHDMD